MTILGLFAILILVLFLPFLLKKVEGNLEIFLFVIGCIAVTVTAQWNAQIIKDALTEPIKITLAVFIAGSFFKAFQKPLCRSIDRIIDKSGPKLFAFLVIVILGFLSSIITAIIAALVLVEIISCMELDRKKQISLTILTCFSIGLGAALTPIGEPLSTIAVAKLKGPPYHAGFFFLFNHLWLYIIPAIMLFGILGIIFMPAKLQKKKELGPGKEEDLKDISIRSIKVYIFVMALIFLGKGFKPMIDMYISKMPYQGLYWLNMLSAIVDNATLTAAEIGPSMNILQINFALMGLLIAGGMLIPGNIPNIIAAEKLKIRSTEWAKIGVPLGLAVMTACFLLLMAIRTL